MFKPRQTILPRLGDHAKLYELAGQPVLGLIG
jgi:hypothetical protein